MIGKSLAIIEKAVRKCTHSIEFRNVRKRFKMYKSYSRVRTQLTYEKSYTTNSVLLRKPYVIVASEKGKTNYARANSNRPARGRHFRRYIFCRRVFYINNLERATTRTIRTFNGIMKTSATAIQPRPRFAIYICIRVGKYGEIVRA